MKRAVVVLLVAVLWAGNARAEDAPPLRRIVGFGSAQGQTIAGGTLWTAPERVGGSAHDAMFGLTLPTFELRFFAPKLYFIDLSSSLGATIFAASFDHAFYLTQDAFFTFHLGRGVARFIGGPGLGFSVALHEDGRGVQDGASLRFVSQLGLELLSKNHAFGFEIIGRPWVELTRTQSLGESHAFASGGFAHLIAFFGYFRK